jgi:RimJ/RimL family protein N-acetyltransferase
VTAADPAVTELTTPRLRLRGWQEADREPFAALNADPEVMRFFPGTRDRAESDAAIDRYRAGFAERGYGLWAVEVRATGDFAGFVGLNPAPATVPAAPAMEIGWRLARAHWGQGYAPEAACAVLDHAFGPLGLTELVSFTVATNAPSRRVMEKLGMTHDPAEDWDTPDVPGWADLPHVIYRLRATDYVARTAAS